MAPMAAMDEAEGGGFAGWVILELMGHRRLAGWLSEQEIAGEGFLRLDIPGDPQIVLDASAEADAVTGTGVTQFYAPGAVYCITPTTEETARLVAKLGQPEPVRRWELPAPDDGDGEPL